MRRVKEVDQDETNAASSIDLATKGNNSKSQTTQDQRMARANID